MNKVPYYASLEFKVSFRWKGLEGHVEGVGELSKAKASWAKLLVLNKIIKMGII